MNKSPKLTKNGERNALQCYHNNVGICRGTVINILKRFVLNVFVKTEKENLDTPKVANLVIDVNFINKTIEC